MSTARRSAGLALAATLTALGVVTAGCGSTTIDRPMMGLDGQHVRQLGCVPPRLPGTTVHVVVSDMGRMMAGYGQRMMLRALPATVPAGPISFEVANMGWRTHELVVLPLAAGRAAGTRTSDSTGRIDETASLGEASATCAAGEGDGIRSGAAGWVTLSLPPGRYELVCNRPHHYADGMYQAFTVS